MQKNRIGYAILRYCPRREPADRRQLLLLALEREAGLTVVVRPGWGEEVDPEDREYLAQFLNHWRTMPSNCTQQLLEELGTLSIGPLRTVDSGHMDTETMAALMQYASRNQVWNTPCSGRH